MSSSLVEITCCSCAITFGMTQALMDFRKKDCLGFFCPNGHAQAYQSTTDQKEAELKKLRSDLTEATEKVTQLQKQVEELKTELDIWRPASAIANGAGMPGEKVIEEKVTR